MDFNKANYEQRISIFCSKPSPRNVLQTVFAEGSGIWRLSIVYLDLIARYLAQCLRSVLPDGLDQLPPIKVLIKVTITKVFKAEL